MAEKIKAHLWQQRLSYIVSLLIVAAGIGLFFSFFYERGANAAPSNISFVDNDNEGYGLDGRDFKIILGNMGATPAGFELMQVFIVSSSLELATNTLGNACTSMPGNACEPLAFFGGNYETDIPNEIFLPPHLKFDSNGQAWTTTSQYVAWVFVSSTESSIVSSTLLSTSTPAQVENRLVFDTPEDNEAPFIEHIPANGAQASVAAYLYASVFDEQTTPEALDDTEDGGNEYVKLHYGNDLSNEVDGALVEGELFEFTVPMGGVPAAGGTFNYYLEVRDASENTRFLCANHQANSAEDCEEDPFVVTTVNAGARSVAGTIQSGGENIENARVFLGGFAKQYVSTDANGDYSFANLPNNMGLFGMLAVKDGYCMNGREENLAAADLADIDFNLNEGECRGGGEGGPPHMIFSGPPEGAQHVPVGETIRLGFDQPLDANTIRDEDPTDENSNVFLTTDGEDRIAGRVLYCASDADPGCDDIPEQDRNVIVFDPTANLSTQTRYSLVVTEAVTSEFGQSIEGNRPGGGHKVDFFTQGQVRDFAEDGDDRENFGDGGEFMPPFIRAMTPAPGMQTPRNSKIFVEFNEPIDSQTVSVASGFVRLIDLSDDSAVDVSISLDSNEKRFLTITPDANLSANTEYELQVKGGVSNVNAVPMRLNANDIAFSNAFRTNAVVDNVAPSIYPFIENNDSIAVNEALGFGFSEQMDFSTLNSQQISFTRGNSAVSAEFDYDSGANELFIVPNSVLAPNTNYVVNFSTGTTDLMGIEIATATAFTYTTAGADGDAPTLAEARCDDFACFLRFDESMNSASEADGADEFAKSVLNHENITLSDGGDDLVGANTILVWEAAKHALIIEDIEFPAESVGDSYTITVDAAVTDLSDNGIAVDGENDISLTIEDSRETFGDFDDGGMFGPPRGDHFGDGGEVGDGRFEPVGFGEHTIEEFFDGRAARAFPFNQMAGQDVNVFHIEFLPGIALAQDDIVLLTFPNGTDVANTAKDTHSPFFADFNEADGDGIVTFADANDITVNEASRQVRVKLKVTNGPTGANDRYAIDLRGITNPAVPKGPETGGYTVEIKVLRGEDEDVLVTQTSMPYFINEGGERSITLDFFAASSTNPDAVAGTMFMFGGGPSGPQDQEITFNNGTTTVELTNLPDGCYFFGTEPFVTLGDNDYFGQDKPEPVCVNADTPDVTKNFVLAAADGGGSVSTTVKFADGVDFGGRDIDIFAGGPGRFVVKTIENVGEPEADGYTLRLPANGSWFVGFGPAHPKGAADFRPEPLPCSPTPPIDLQVSDLGGEEAGVSAGFFQPPGVTFDDNTDTIIFECTEANLTVAGTVRDGEGNAIPDIEVFMHQQGFGAPAFGRTDASGAFSIGVADYGSYEIGTFKEGLPPSFQVVDLRNEEGLAVYFKGENVTNNFTLQVNKPDLSISGKVLDADNNPMSGAPVFASNDTTGEFVPAGFTGQDGSYIVFVNPGTWTVRAELPPEQSSACGTFSTQVEVVAGSSQANQNITPSGGECVTISGTVTFGGETQANVPIFIEQWNIAQDRPAGGFFRMANTNADGEYTADVPGGGDDYRVGTFDPDFGEMSITIEDLNADAADQDITSGNTADLTFNFTDGTSEMSAFIEVKNDADKHQRFGKQINGLDEAAVFTVKEGTYNYFIDVFGFGQFSGTLQTGNATAIDLSTAEFIVVTGTVKNAADDVIEGALVTFTHNTEGTIKTALVDENGEYEMKVKAGDWDVSVKRAGYVSAEALDVTFEADTAAYDIGGDDPDVTAPVQATRRISGVVYSNDGETPMTKGFVEAKNITTGKRVNAPLDADDGSYVLVVSDGIWKVNAVGPLHLRTDYTQNDVLQTLTMSANNASEANINITLDEDDERIPKAGSGAIAAGIGGSINDSDNSGVKLTAAAGVLQAADGDVSINMERNFDAPRTDNFAPIGDAIFDITATGNSTIKNLNGNIEIQIDYTDLIDDLPDDVEEADLKLMYYSPERDDYIPVEGGFTVDPENNTIIGQVNHLTDFAVVGSVGEDPPSTPTGFTASANGTTQIDLSWNAVGDATGYNIFRDTSVGGDFPRLGDEPTVSGANTVSYTDTDVSVGNTYYYKIAAYSEGGQSANSATRNATLRSGGGPIASGPPPAVPEKKVPVSPVQRIIQRFPLLESQPLLVGASEHTVTVQSLTETSVTALIQSDTIEAILIKDEAQVFDTNSDGILDLEAVYLGMIAEEAQIQFSNLTDEGEGDNAFSVNAGAYETDSREVTLFFNVDNATQVALSNTEDFAGRSFEAYQSLISWELSEGNGTKRVYVKFRTEGGLSSVEYDDILLTGQESDALPVGQIENSLEETQREEDESMDVLPPVSDVACSLEKESAYKVVDNPAVWYITDRCTRRVFRTSERFFSFFESWDDVHIITQERLEMLPQDDISIMGWGSRHNPKYGAVVKMLTNPKVYLLLGDKRHWIRSSEVFEALRYSWDWIEDVSRGLLEQYAPGEEITDMDVHPQYTIISYSNDEKVYRLEPDPVDPNITVKRHIKNMEVFDREGYRDDRIIEIDDAEVYPDGEVIE